MSEGGAALTRFAFANGVWRGTHLTLFTTCLVHRSEHHMETLPIAGMTGVRVAFERDTRKIGWGIGLIVLALVLLAISGPIERFATEAAAEMAKSEQGVGRALYAFFRFLVALASLLPVAALACVVGGAALAALGWLGSTTLTVSLPGAERVYPSRGRDTALLGFAEAVGERLMLRR